MPLIVTIPVLETEATFLLPDIHVTLCPCVPFNFRLLTELPLYVLITYLFNVYVL